MPRKFLMKHQLTLVKCSPYSAQMVEATCARRYFLANKPDSGARNRVASEARQARNKFMLCMGCEAGKERHARVDGSKPASEHTNRFRHIQKLGAAKKAAAEANQAPAVVEAPAAEREPPQEKTKMRTCKMDGCEGRFVATTNRAYCDAHKDPKTRKPKKRKKRKKNREAKGAAASAQPTAPLVDVPPTYDDMPTSMLATSPAPSSGAIASARELLELAGYQVTAMRTPRGELLLVGGQS